MGKKGESKFSIFDCCLPKAASPATFQSPPRSPHRGLSGRVVSPVPHEGRRKGNQGAISFLTGKKGKSKFSIFDCLPKAASPVTFQSPPPSPRSPHRGLSGRFVSLVPQEARRKGRSGSCDEREEPSSPKVSCTGKVNNKNKIKPQATKPESSPKPAVLKGKKQGLQPDTSRGSPPDADKGPSLVHMKRFSSSCSELKDFDWRAHDEVFIVVEVDEDIPREPKKQVNLWKRRSMAHPGPLQLEKLSPC
ncbi:RNA polymerase II, heptapeptide repeat, eukaryotic [Salix suchowensis]|nr:RNA polymerase II, heptapeptide repeat, eukaryotic [Salix suchowensis]